VTKNYEAIFTIKHKIIMFVTKYAKHLSYSFHWNLSNRGETGRFNNDGTKLAGIVINCFIKYFGSNKAAIYTR